MTIYRLILGLQMQIASCAAFLHVKPMSGFEPPTVRLRIECSTTELHRHWQLYSIAQIWLFLKTEAIGNNYYSHHLNPKSKKLP